MLPELGRGCRGGGHSFIDLATMCNGTDRVNGGSSSASNSLCADCLISREYLTTRVATLQAACPVSLVWNGLFFAPRFRHQTVPEVLPYRPVFFQVDENADLAGFLIGDKLDSTHDFIFLQVTASAPCTSISLP